MSNIATSISGVLGRITSGLESLGGFASDLVGGVASFIPAAQAVGQIGQQFGLFDDPFRPPILTTRSGGNPSAMPGGAPTMPNRPTNFVSAQPASFGLTLPSMSSAVDVLQGQGSVTSSCITPRPVPATMRLPREVHVPDPNGSGIRAYVLAPKARYKVTVRGPRRRSGGR